MKRFGGTHRNFKTRKPSFFSRSKKVVPFSPRRRIRHSAESLILRSRFQTYGQRNVMPNFWKIFKRVLLPALCLTWFGLLIFLPYFRVTKVAFYGLQIIKKDE